jgi:hypothetical protein
MKVCCLEIQQFVYKFTWLVPLCENVLLLSSLVSNWICQSSCTNHMVKFLGGLSAELKVLCYPPCLKKSGRLGAVPHNLGHLCMTMRK